MDQMPFQALFEHSSIGIIISNTDGVIEKSNLFASKIFGYKAEELNGQKIEVLIPEHLKEKHVAFRKMYNANPQPRTMGSNLNLLAVKKNGEQFPIEISLSFFETGSLRRIVSFVNDITARKKSEDELKKLTEELETKVNERTRELSKALLELGQTNAGLSQEMEQRKKIEAQIRHTLEREKELSELKSRFVSMASHEFRTPLSGILSSASLIASYHKPEDESKREKHIQTIKKSVKNLTSILNDFLSLDKLNQGRVVSHPVHFSLTSLIEEIIEEFKNLSDPGQRIIVEHKNGELQLFQDKDMLRNVVINLLTNSIKYSPNDKNIYLRTSIQKENTLSLEVEDFGIGIPEEDQKHLFELFFRANNAGTIQGTGLGLNIVKRYLDMMDGDLCFKSVENNGTTFTVTLPLEKLS